MRKDNPFLINKVSKTESEEILEGLPGLQNPLERELWALETPYLLPKNYQDPVPEGLFDSIIAGTPLIEIPHTEALVAFFDSDFVKAKSLFEPLIEDPYSHYNLILCLESLGDREKSLEFWQEKLNEEITWIQRLAIYEHLRTNFALHDYVHNDIIARFIEAEPTIMLKILSHLVLHKDFTLAEELWVKGVIEFEELEDYGVDLALASGRLNLAISRLKNLNNPKDKSHYVEDFIKVVALKSLEDGDNASGLEMIETLLSEFYDSLTTEEQLMYLRLKCSCSLEIIENDVNIASLSEENKKILRTGIEEVKNDLTKDFPKIKKLVDHLGEEQSGPEDTYMAYLTKLLESLS